MFFSSPVTEVVWEGEDTETKKADIEMTKKEDSNATKKVNNNTVTNNINRLKRSFSLLS